MTNFKPTSATLNEMLNFENGKTENTLIVKNNYGKFIRFDSFEIAQDGLSLVIKAFYENKMVGTFNFQDIDLLNSGIKITGFYGHMKYELQE